RAAEPRRSVPARFHGARPRGLAARVPTRLVTTPTPTPSHPPRITTARREERLLEHIAAEEARIRKAYASRLEQRGGQGASWSNPDQVSARREQGRRRVRCPRRPPVPR